MREDGFALEDIDLGLEVGFERVGGGFIGGGVHVAHVEEVLVEVLDLNGGAGLVDGRLGKGEEDGGEEAEAGDEDERAFAAAEHVPVLEQQAGALVIDHHHGRRRCFHVRGAGREIGGGGLALHGLRIGGFFHSALVLSRNKEEWPRMNTDEHG